MPRIVSVIIPFYNEAELLNRAVLSVFDQSAQVEVEILVCNDGPLSESDISLAMDSRLRGKVSVIANRYCRGPGGARNTGLDVSTGDCIAFLDADDFWLPCKLESQLAAIDSGATFVATAYRLDNSRAIVRPPAAIEQSLDVFLHRGIGTSTVIITRALLGSLRFKDIRFAQDIDFWYALARSPHFRYTAVEAHCVEYSTGGTTKNKWVQLQYLHKVLRINDVPWVHHFRVLFSYVLAGIYNHFIKRLFP